MAECCLTGRDSAHKYFSYHLLLVYLAAVIYYIWEKKNFWKKNPKKNWVQCEVNKSRELSAVTYASIKEKENWRHTSDWTNYEAQLLLEKKCSKWKSVYEGRLGSITEKFENTSENYSLVFSTCISSAFLKATRSSIAIYVNIKSSFILAISINENIIILLGFI